MKDDKITKLLGTIVLIPVVLFIASIISGTILWLIYPHIHSIFPSAASNGIIAHDLGWWDSVCVTWIFAILIKCTSVNNKD